MHLSMRWLLVVLTSVLANAFLAYPGQRTFSPARALFPLQKIPRPRILCAAAAKIAASLIPALQQRFPKLWKALERRNPELVEEILSPLDISVTEQRILDVAQAAKDEGKKVDDVLMEKFNIPRLEAAFINIACADLEDAKLDPSLNARLHTLPAGEARYKELIRIASLPNRLSPTKLTFDLEEQHRQMGCFSKSEAVIPFIEYDDRKLIEMRFANRILTGKPLTPEAESLRETKSAVMFFPEGSGKTSTIFDVARKEYTIFASSHRQADPIFGALMDDIDDTIYNWQENYNGALESARRLIRAEICARVVFLRWFMETCPKHDQSPESFLVTQLNGAQDWIHALYRKLRAEHVEVIKSLLVESQAALLSTEAASYRYVIDEAQVAAYKYYPIDSSGQADEFQFKDRNQSDERHGLLYEYTHLVLEANPHSAMAIATTGPYIDLPENLTWTPVALPVLKVKDVRDRLMRMLNVSAGELDQCMNLHMLQGRPRWCTAVIGEIPGALQDPLAKHELKHKTLDKIIANLAQQFIDKEVKRLEAIIPSMEKLKYFARLQFSHPHARLQKLFQVYSLFEGHENGITSSGDLDAKLREQLSVAVRFEAGLPELPLDDFVTRSIVLKLGQNRGWNATELAQKALLRLGFGRDAVAESWSCAERAAGDVPDDYHA